MNQVNNELRKTLTAEIKDELIFVSGKDIRYFFLDAFLLVLGKIVVFYFWLRSTAGKCVKKLIIDDFKPTLLWTQMKDLERFFAQN